MKTYAIEGYYPVRSKCPPATINDPKTWVRTWLTWHTVKTLKEAEDTMKNGLRIMDPESFTGFNKLRIVEVTETRKVVTGAKDGNAGKI